VDPQDHDEDTLGHGDSDARRPRYPSVRSTCRVS
jgi:hypothetical protein